jgi:hypothetical protein
VLTAVVRVVGKCRSAGALAEATMRGASETPVFDLPPVVHA